MIQERAMLVTLSISQWSARKQDKKVTAEVELAHAAHNAGKFNKMLVAKDLLEPLNQISGKIRDTHYKLTLSWDDNGARMLPSRLFAEHTAAMRTHRADFDKALNDFVAVYPAEVQAARNRLGTMYNPGDYPDPSEIRSKFGMSIRYFPVPAAEDFRVDVGEEAKAEICASITQSIADRQSKAVQSTFTRVKDVVARFATTLSDPEAKIYDTMVTNAIDLCSVLEGLNITDDPLITAVCQDMRTHLLMPPSTLRANSVIREDTARHAQRILALLP